MKILVVTNGHGEDQLAVCLIKALQRQWPELHIEAIPLVGEGRRLAAAGVALDGPRVRVPSGGLVRPQMDAVWRDLRAGLLGQMRRQMAFVRSRRDAIDAVIAVGDVFAAFVARRGLPAKPLMLVSTAKSAYITGHSALETRWMRRHCRHVFARDEPTAAALREAGVTASWAGNLMMDALDVTGRQLLPAAHGPIVALLPGSRDDAYVNLRGMADIVTHLAAAEPRGAQRSWSGLVPLAPGLDSRRVVSDLTPRGWHVVGERDSPSEEEGPPSTVLHNRGAALHIVEGAFGDVIASADIVVGLAGTANEQAAGLGKPVIAYPGPGVQFGPRFLHAQRRLLGDALRVVAPDAAVVAATIREILAADDVQRHMAAVGHERMGPPGGAERMAAAIVRMWRG